jgi:hypothetical protein
MSQVKFGAQVQWVVHRKDVFSPDTRRYIGKVGRAVKAVDHVPMRGTVDLEFEHLDDPRRTFCVLNVPYDELRMPDDH